MVKSDHPKAQSVSAFLHRSGASEGGNDSMSKKNLVLLAIGALALYMLMKNNQPVKTSNTDSATKNVVGT